ncbi:GntR family transcriptional regulator [Synergistales bacterium]|nr:GntR family transcriptional regulator [Synergistales bacterium]
MATASVVRGGNVFTPLERKSRSVVVFEALKEKILSGFWSPGEQLYTEAELVGAFRVGRSTVREALNLLKANNLVYTVPGMGTFVNDPSYAVKSPPALDPDNLQDVLSVMEFRVAYEPYCAALAAMRITDAEIEKLVSCVESQIVNVSSDKDPAGFAELDMNFHYLLSQATRNALFSHSFELIREHLLRQQVISASYTERRKRAMKYHQQIIKALQERDAKQAELVMSEHVKETQKAISALLDA